MDKELKFISEVSKVIAKLGGRVYYVGGYVRDKLLNKENKDIDVEVYGIPINKLKTILSRYGEVLEVGESFGILMVKGYDIDFSLPRTETKVGVKHTDFEVTVNYKLGVKEATKRRDFTINSILQDVITLEYIDYYNGIEDIKKGVIRYVNEDTFIEDELRVFRACQFSSRFNFKIDDKIKELVKDFTYKSLSKERIYEELNKALLKSDKPSIAFNNLLNLGVIEKLYPELYSLIGCEQGKKHHPEGDVWNHTMLVLDEASKLKDKSKTPLYFMYSALCHDLGKPNTYEDTEGKITFYNHESEGVEVALKFMSKLTNETKLLDYVKTMTLNHMKGHNILTIRDKSLRKLMVGVDIEELLLITEADELGRGRVTEEDRANFGIKLSQYKERIGELSEGEFGKITPYFSGKDLLNLGYKPGKELGITLREAYTQQLSGVSKDDILKYLKGKLKPKERLNVEDLVGKELYKLLGEDKRKHKLTQKRINVFKDIYKKTEDKYKFKVTKQGIPYLEVISIRGSNKVKYLITPLYILELSLDNKVRENILDVYEIKEEERIRIFKRLLSELPKGTAINLNFLIKVYGRIINLN